MEVGFVKETSQNMCLHFVMAMDFQVVSLDILGVYVFLNSKFHWRKNICRLRKNSTSTSALQWFYVTTGLLYNSSQVSLEWYTICCRSNRTLLYRLQTILSLPSCVGLMKIDVRQPPTEQFYGFIAGLQILCCRFRLIFINYWICFKNCKWYFNNIVVGSYFIKYS